MAAIVRGLFGRVLCEAFNVRYFALVIKVYFQAYSFDIFQHTIKLDNRTRIVEQA